MNGTLEDLEVCFDTFGSEEKMVTIDSGLSVVSLVTREHSHMTSDF